MSKVASVRRQLPAKIIYRSPGDLCPYKNNSRIHTPKQIGRIAQSIKHFGFLGVVLVGPDGGIIVGHARVLAALQIGLKSVPTVCVNHLSEAERRTFLIADNRLSELSSFDVEILGKELTEIGLLDPDLDLGVTGFDEETIEIYLDATSARTSNTEPEVPEVQAGPWVTQAGQLWLLGEHKLYCGDAIDPSSYKVLMGRERAKQVISDVPYNLKINGFVSGNGKVKHREFLRASGEMTVEQFTRFLTDALSLFERYSSNGSLHYIFIDHRHLFELITAGRAVYDEQLNLIVWQKTSPALGSFYRSQHELILLFKKGKAAHVNNISLGKHGRNRSNVWTYPGANSFSANRAEELSWHSTVKPLALIADAILDASRRGDIILDGFGGSGTTLMAAEQSGRKARLMELDPGYCDVRYDASSKRPVQCRRSPRRVRLLLPLKLLAWRCVMDEGDFSGPRNRGQFPKGKSGNPKGRPRGAKGMKTIVHEAAMRKVAINIGGRRREVTALEAVIATMRAEALRGDRYARQEFLTLCARHAVGELEQVAKATLTDGEQEILAGILGRSAPAAETDDG